MNKKSAVIMGATSGIGREVAKILALSGWTLGICGRRGELLESFRALFPQQVTVAEIDVCDEDAGERLVALAQSVDAQLYLHSSGVGWQNGSLESVKEIDTVRTNGEGFVRCVGAMFRYFSTTGGHIAVISSIAGTKGLGPAPAYSATKRMQNIYIDALEQLARMRRLNITFSDIRPGFVDTALINGGKDYCEGCAQEAPHKGGRLEIFASCGPVAVYSEGDMEAFSAEMQFWGKRVALGLLV